MPASRYVPVSPEWNTLRTCAQALLAALPPVEPHTPDQLIDTLAVAQCFKAVALQLREATLTSGQTSQRFSAVVKALEFSTPKSALQSFLQGDEAPPANSR